MSVGNKCRRRKVWFDACGMMRAICYTPAFEDWLMAESGTPTLKPASSHLGLACEFVVACDKRPPERITQLGVSRLL